MQFKSISHLLSHQTKKYEDKPFIIFNKQKYTYSQVEKKSSALAAHLQKKFKIKKGNKVAVKLTNSPEFIFSWFAIVKLGAIMVPINPNYNQKETDYIYTHSEAKLLINKDFKFSFSQKSNVKGQKLDRSDIASILYTSGTTGKPKGVLLPHRTYIIGGESFAMRAELTDKDRMMVILPLFHVNAQVYSIMGALVSGATLILRPRFSASAFWQDINKYQVTQFNFLGVVANILLKDSPTKEEKTHHVRVAFGAGMSKQTILKFQSRFSIPLIETYGLTECPMGTSNLISERNPGSIGKPSRHPNPKLFTQIKIKDNEILLKSPVLTPGYFKNPQANKAAFKNGWFHTGDLGRIDKDGWVYFLDRKKDIIRKRGENISSKEIEGVIKKIPGVTEVAVIPIPGALGDDDIKAYIVTSVSSLTLQAVLSQCKKYLSSIKMPSLVEFIGSLPKTPTQKIAKNILKKEFAKNYEKESPDTTYILDGIRTPIGKVNKSLRDYSSYKLLASCYNHLIKKYQQNISNVIVGSAYQFGENTKDLARLSVLESRLPKNTPSQTVTRKSASGMEAIRVEGNNKKGLSIAAGAESFSRVPHKMSDSGKFADMLSKRFNISRKAQDEFAFNSNQKALSAQKEFAKEILKVGSAIHDEIPKKNLSSGRLKELPPIYSKSGTITAGNASKLSDGAAALLLSSKQFALKSKLKPLAKVVGIELVTTKPEDYGIAPVEAVQNLLNRHNLTLDHMGIIEIHEAYAVTALATLKLLRLPQKRINRYGGAIALGHPFGMTGARLALTATHQLHTCREDYALIAICIGGGQGMATILKKV